MSPRGSCKDEKVAEAKGQPRVTLAAAPAAEAKALTGRELIRQTSQFYFDDPSFEKELEAWASARCASFSPLDTEYSLMQSALFDEFKQLFEGRLERYYWGLI